MQAACGCNRIAVRLIIVNPARRDKVTGWFSNDPIDLVDTYRGQWRSADFEMGDALIFGIYTTPGSPSNTPPAPRLTFATRDQRLLSPYR